MYLILRRLSKWIQTAFYNEWGWREIIDSRYSVGGERECIAQKERDYRLESIAAVCGIDEEGDKFRQVQNAITNQSPIINDCNQCSLLDASYCSLPETFRLHKWLFSLPRWKSLQFIVHNMFATRTAIDLCMLCGCMFVCACVRVCVCHVCVVHTYALAQICNSVFLSISLLHNSPPLAIPPFQSIGGDWGAWCVCLVCLVCLVCVCVGERELAFVVIWGVKCVPLGQISVINH